MMRCEDIVERLPWLLSSTLPDAEKREVEEHLEECSGCREELELVRGASALFAGHIPVRDLADYGLGRAVFGISREVLDLHLAHCASCRHELELVQEDGEESRSFERSPSHGWRNLAVAASLAAVAGVTGLLWQGARIPAPRADVAGVMIVELLPESFATRGAEPEPEILEPAHDAAVLVLVTDRAEAFEDIRLRVTDEAGRAIWEVTGLERSAAGDFSVYVPEGALPAGEMSISLEAFGADGWTTIETYGLILGPGPAS